MSSFTDVGGVPEYVIGPDDVLEITLRDVQVVREKVIVRPDGYISFALIENIHAGGLTPSQLDDALTEALSAFMRRPKVDVKVFEFRSKYVSMLGALQTNTESGTRMGQGRYPLKTRTTILDAILEAGGATADAQLQRVQLVRKGQSYRLDLQRVLNTGEKTHNVVLQAEDIVIVPGTNIRNKKVVVLGEVERQGVYMFSQEARLIEALSQAGGLRDNALRDDLRVIRVVDGDPRMLRVNFEHLTGRAEVGQNVVLENDDIIYVPRSFMGDVNDVISKIEPLLNVLLLPATYRDLYTTGGGLRVDTGQPETEAPTFRRILPNSANKASAEQQDTSDLDDQ